MAKGGGCLKVLGGGVVVVALLLGVGWLRRDAILESTLEGQLQSVTGVPAEIEKLETDPFQGTLSLESLTLDNPEGFSSPHALKIDRLDLSLDPNTVFQDTVVIHSLAVSGIKVKLEQKLAQNNLAQLADKVKTETASERGSGSGKRVKIAKLTLQDIDASVKLSIIGGFGVNQTLEIGDVVVEDINSYNAEGKLMEAITAAVTGAVLRELANPANLGNLLN